MVVLAMKRATSVAKDVANVGSVVVGLLIWQYHSENLAPCYPGDSMVEVSIWSLSAAIKSRWKCDLVQYSLY